MQDYSELSYFQLKAECSKLGKSPKGTKDDLIARLNGEEVEEVKTESQNKEAVDRGEKIIKAQSPNPEQKPIDAKSPLHSERLDRLQLLKPDSRIRHAVDPEIYKEWVNNERLEVLKNKLDPIVAGKGKFDFVLKPNDGVFGVEFTGGVLGKNYTTLIDTDAQIVKQASFYFNSRLHSGKNGQISRI